MHALEGKVQEEGLVRMVVRVILDHDLSFSAEELLEKKGEEGDEEIEDKNFGKLQACLTAE